MFLPVQSIVQCHPQKLGTLFREYNFVSQHDLISNGSSFFFLNVMLTVLLGEKVRLLSPAQAYNLFTPCNVLDVTLRLLVVMYIARPSAKSDPFTSLRIKMWNFKSKYYIFKENKSYYGSAFCSSLALCYSLNTFLGYTPVHFSVSWDWECFFWICFFFVLLHLFPSSKSSSFFSLISSFGDILLLFLFYSLSC